MEEKPHLNLAVIGHGGCGKSSICGQILIAKEKVDAYKVDKIQNEATLLGKGSSVFAFILDKLKSERDRGMSLNNHYEHFESDRFRFTLIDTPGNRDLYKMMITGASQADCVLLVMSAQDGEFETGVSKAGASKEHTMLAYSLGVREIIVAVNKMDHPSVNFSEDRFNTIAFETKSFIKATGFSLENVQVIPVSGFLADNIALRSDKMPWYSGPLLLEALDGIVCPRRPFDLPLRMPISDRFKISGVGTVAMGKVETGVMKTGMEIAFAPGNIVATCRSIEMNGRQVQQAFPGDNIGFNIKGLSCREITRGLVASDANNKPASEVSEFLAQIVVLNHPSKIEKGYTPIVYCHNAMVACRVSEILEKIDKRTGKVAEKEPKFISTGDAALVRFVPLKPMCVENYKEYAPLGRFAVRDMKQTVAVGIIKEITKKVETKK